MMMDFDWDDPNGGLDEPIAGPSFIERARNAPDDDDDLRLWGGGPDAPNIIPQEVAEETSLQKLTRYWMNERHAPDILPAQETLLGRLLDHIRKQSDDVQLLRADPDASEDEHFRIMLVQTEIERVKFVIRSYMRTRLHKIEKYAKHINMTESLQQRLSKGELEHARTYAKLVDSHFVSSVLQSLPEEQRALDDEVPFMPPMISKPDLKRPVFAHARQACPPVRLPDGSTMEMEKGQISLTPYEVIEQLLFREEVELV
ncbi:GINS complex Sld5 component [Irpex rosettiformis]|uniref:GINS complex Sld5 component n=1 Tax=Irpex rosettiformis TaxID=378272 RepID=A0ACB8TT79_9APHY|nr:GINS complex Sld5 component [Irpex rosettiformis]